jgi:hypothetical protein
MEGLPPDLDDQEMRQFHWKIGRQEEEEKHRT